MEDMFSLYHQFCNKPKLLVLKAKTLNSVKLENFCN
jgi:hypothetical protein